MRQTASMIACYLISSLMATGAYLKADEIEIAQITREGPVSFASEVLPILKDNCLACHNASEAEGELNLESRDSILLGGATGPVVVPGNSEESYLLTLASHAGDPVMPPEDNEVSAKNLTPEQLGLLKLWIDQGAIEDSIGIGLSPKNWTPLPSGVHPVYAVALSSDGQYLACGRANQIHLYHVPTGQLVTRLVDPSLEVPGVAHLDLVQSLTFNDQGGLLASGGFREVKLWRRPRDVQIHSFTTGVPIEGLSASSNQRWIAAVGAENSILVWDSSSGEVTATLKGHTAPITSLQFDPLNHALASSSADGTLIVWSIEDGVEIGRITTDITINAVEWVPLAAKSSEAPNSENQSEEMSNWRERLATEFWLVSGSDDNKIHVWIPPTRINVDPEEASSDSATEVSDEASSDTESDEPVDPNAAFVVREITGHSQPITSLAAFPGAPRQILSGSRDGTMRRWNLDNGQQITQFNHGGPVMAIAARPDGQKLASSSENKTTRLWNPNGQRVAELRGDVRRLQERDRLTQELRAANTRLNVAKQQLAAAEADLPKKVETAQTAESTLAEANKKVEELTTKVSEALTAKNEAEAVALESASDAKEALEAKENAERLAAQARDSLERIQETVTQLTTASQLDPNNARLQELLAQSREEVTAIQEEVQQLTQAIQEPTQLAQQAANKATQAAQAAIPLLQPYNDALQELKTAQSEQNLASQQQAIAAIERKRAEELVPIRNELVAKFEKQVEETQKQLDDATRLAQEAEQPIVSVSFSPDGSILATAGDYQNIHTWDSETGAPVAAYAGHDGAIKNVLFLHDQAIISGGNDGSVRLWEVNPAWTLEKTLGDAEQSDLISHRVTAVDFNRDASLLVAGSGVPSRTGDLTVFDVGTGEIRSSMPDVHNDVIYCAEFSPDGTRIASGGADKYVWLSNWSEGQTIRRLEGHTNYVLSVSWQGDGTVIASSSADESVKVWDSTTGDQRRTIGNMTKAVTGVQHIGESSNVVTSGGDRRVRIQDTNSGRVVRNFSTWNTWLHCVDVTPDGQVVVAGAADGSIGVWNATNGSLLHRLEVPEKPEE